MLRVPKIPVKYAIPALAAGLLLLQADQLLAQETVVEFDPGRTKVEFTLGDVLHTVHGAFRLKSGTIRFNPATGDAAGYLVIDARSGESGSKARDGRMHKNILESQKFPEVTFTPHRIKGPVALNGDSQVEVEGTFNIHGADHPVTMPAKVSASNGQMTISVHFAVPYVDWGMKNPSTFFLRVSDKVDIDIQATARVLGGKS